RGRYTRRIRPKESGSSIGAERATRPTARHLNWVMPAEGTNMSTATSSAVEATTGGQFLKVEEHGIEPIPLPERRGRTRDLGVLWAGAVVNYPRGLTASLATTYLG